MISLVFKAITGRHYRKFIRKSRPLVARINELEESYQVLSEEELRAKTDEFRKRIAAGETTEDLLPEAFAAVKNAARRLCGRMISVCGQELPWEMVHYDVQLIGGMALHERRIAEMATGEGKTLVATLPLYLNALTGRNSQLVTVNDYLARRDSEWMGTLFQLLGLTCGCIQSGMPPAQRREMYQRDITYGTASEFGFDYLRDNGMATRKEDQVQRDHYFCIVDEADSILIDEARTPLIISGPIADDRPMPFDAVKGGVQNLVRKQLQLCNRLANEAKEALAGDSPDFEKAAANLYLVRNGNPKNKILLRLVEAPETRKLVDKFELEMNSDLNKERRFRLKEHLFYLIDERQQQADLTEQGRTLLRPDDPDAFVMPDLPLKYMEIEQRKDLDAAAKEKEKAKAQEAFSKTSEEIHCISQLLRAYSLYERDDEYVVQDGKVVIVDENTGRPMPGRRWGDGLHQAVEAKEGVAIEKESKTFATITIQNYFRMYERLSGMTGTAETEASEFNDIYRCNVMVIPTHRPCVRVDYNDVVYKSRRAKYNAVLKQIEEAYGRGQPVLVGTTSVESSEVLSRMLKRANITHNVLNAKFHQQEAEIVARAGQHKAVTIATNMAGRGTDIKLGEGVAEVGGLLVIGTERHESRRIDRQLRGRCARQGDPGTSRFFVSLEDDLMRLFANAGPLSRILEGSLDDDAPLDHKILNWSIENAQKKVEQQNYSIRKRLLQYDDVLNKQREIIYEMRNEAIHSDNPSELLFELVDEAVEERVAEALGQEDKTSGAPQWGAFSRWINTHFPIALKVEELESAGEGAAELVVSRIREAYEQRSQTEDETALVGLARYVVIRSIDRLWQDHLTEMEELRRGVSLRGYGQRDPLNEYKSEAFKVFEELLNNLRNEVCSTLFRSATNLNAFQNMLARLSQNAKAQGPDSNQSLVAAAAGKGDAPGKPTRKLPQVTVRREVPKIGRNQTVKIRRGAQVKEMKFKKAEPLLRSGEWNLEEEGAADQETKTSRSTSS